MNKKDYENKLVRYLTSCFRVKRAEWGREDNGMYYFEVDLQDKESYYVKRSTKGELMLEAERFFNENKNEV